MCSWVGSSFLPCVRGSVRGWSYLRDRLMVCGVSFCGAVNSAVPPIQTCAVRPPQFVGPFPAQLVAWVTESKSCRISPYGKSCFGDDFPERAGASACSSAASRRREGRVRSVRRSWRQFAFPEATRDHTIQAREFSRWSLSLSLYP